MQNNASNTAIKQIQGELVDTKQQVVSGRALDSISQSLAQRDGVLARLLQPNEQRMIAKQLKERIQTATVEDAIDKVTSEANKRCAEIGLIGQAHRNQLLLDQNSHLGQLKHQEQLVVSHEIQSMLADERSNQKQLAETRLLAEDREMLSQLFRHRTTLQMLSVAQTHGVQADQIDQTHAQSQPSSADHGDAS